MTIEEQNSLGMGSEREESARKFNTKYFQKKILTKIFPFSHTVSVKKGLSFSDLPEYFQNFLDIFQICLDHFQVWGVVAPCPLLLRLCTEGIRSVSFISIACSYSGMKPQN